MNDPNLKTGWDTALFVAPMLALLLLSLFRLDGMFTGARRRPAGGEPGRRPHPDAPWSFCDPDGRPWRGMPKAAPVREAEEIRRVLPPRACLSSYRRTRRRLIH